jgi:hypothetical protein
MRILKLFKFVFNNVQEAVQAIKKYKVKQEVRGS